MTPAAFATACTLMDFLTSLRQKERGVSEDTLGILSPTIRPLLRRLQAGGSQPLADMRSGLRLPGLPKQGVAHRARLEQSGFLAQSFRLVGETFFKGFDLLETASLLLHCAAPSFE